MCLPSLSWCNGVIGHLEGETQKLARALSSAKSQHFAAVVEESWATGGSLPFRLMKEPQAPEVLEMSITRPVKLAPQSWLPFGKSWLKLRNADDFQAGDRLVGDVEVKVLAVQSPYISISAAVSRKTAASLVKQWVEADPDVWAPHFLAKWESYWKRDEVGALPADALTYLEKVPQVEGVSVEPLDYSLWLQVLQHSKAHSMRGVDGWGFAELRLIPKAFVDILLLLFQWCEKVQAWPKVFSVWLVILLRKVPTGILPWSSVRPISVAATLYRVWSKMRTRQLLAHARTLASVTVQPCLSTRSIWGIQVELAAELFVQGKSPCGVVLDLIKAFNVVCRAFLQALMVRLGFPKEIVDAWFASMNCLSRQTLVAGAVYGDSSSTTGIPEGDPMSILGMYALCCLFRWVVADYSARALIFSYADNWEIVVDQPEALQDLIVVLDRMTQVCLLPVAPSKCWTWALKASDRSKLKNCELSGQKVPVKTTGCRLGADMSYSFRVAATTRNQRVAAGHKRLLRLRGIPTSRFRKCRLVLGGVFPQALHACEASWVPVSVFGRLRSKVVQALKVEGSGVNPFLATNICAPANVDPQFAALFSRLRLFRQLWKDFPVYRPILLARLASTGSKFKTPTDHLVRALQDLGWEYLDGLCLQDEAGRSFSLVSSSLRHIRSLLAFQWGRYIAGQVSHRKGLASLQAVDIEFSRPSKSLLPSERGLLGQLVCGRNLRC